MSLLKRIHTALSENKINLPDNKHELFSTAHKVLSHLIDYGTRSTQGYGGHEYSSHLLSGHDIGGVKELHKAIGQNIGISPEKTPGSPGIVNYRRPSAQLALLQHAGQLFNGVNAQHGNPFNYGNPKPHHKMSDEQFDTHVEQLRKLNDNKPWLPDSAKKTASQLSRGAKHHTKYFHQSNRDKVVVKRLGESSIRSAAPGSLSADDHEVQWTKKKILSLRPEYERHAAMRARHGTVSRVHKQIKDLERQIKERGGTPDVHDWMK